MRKTKEILCLKLDVGLSNRQVARATGVSCSTVSETVARLKAAGLTWPLPEGLSEAALERCLYRRKGEVAGDTREPDWQHVHAELSRKHVTLTLLWSEYKAGEKLFVDSLWRHPRGRRPRKRRGAPRLPLRGRARGQQLYLRRGLRQRRRSQPPQAAARDRPCTCTTR